MRAASIGMLITLLVSASQASAQSQPVPFPTFEIAAQWPVHEPTGSRLREPVFQSLQSHPHTMTGLLIGAVAGGALGWLFYDALCEAVDNKCFESPVRFVLVGGAIGGALGAAIGSLSD